MIIYFGFTAGAVWRAPANTTSFFSGIGTAYEANSNFSDKEEDPSSHIAVVDFYKAHKHLPASRSFEFKRLPFANPASAVGTSTIKAAYKNASSFTLRPVVSPAPVFIKNCVLRI